MPLRKQEDFVLKWVAWETTRRCNLDCIHCRCASSMDAPSGLFTTEKAMAFVRELASFTKPVLVLSGGEPLLRKDIYDIAGYGTRLGLRVCLATNGTLVDDEACHAMKEAGIKMVALSLDGATEEVHDGFRRMKGAFKGTINAANLLKKHGIPFLINSSFTKRNSFAIKDTFKLAKSLGATAWYMFIIVPMGRGEEIFSELLTQPEYDEILEWHYEQEKKEDSILMRPTCAPHYYRLVLEKAKKDGKGFRRRDLTFSTGAGKGCVAGQTICLVDAFGEVHPCSYMEQSAGNIFEKPLKEIWEDSPLLKSLRDFDGYKGRCGVCEYRHVCGGCRVRAFYETGDVLGEEPLCMYVPRKMRRRSNVSS